jgi:hypothetical protein
MTIPFDGIPASFFSFKLANTITKPVISSSGINSYSPDKIVLGSSSPRSIDSIYNLSLSGCFLHDRILPILRSHCSKIVQGVTGKTTFAAAFCFTFFGLDLKFLTEV